jgi:hypothetical protein
MGAWARFESKDHFTDVEKYTHFEAELPLGHAGLLNWYILPQPEGIYLSCPPLSRAGGQFMEKFRITRFFVAASLAAGLAYGAAVAQTAGQDMKNAGQDTKSAAKDTGHATAQTSKKVYHKTKRGTKKVYHKTAQGTKTAAHRTQNAGDALAGKPPQH